MRHRWDVEPEDIDRVKRFMAKWADTPMVTARSKRNLAPEKPPVTREHFWNVLVACLLTTQQRSGPTSAVTKFLCQDPFPLSVEICDCHPDLSTHAKEILQRFGGIRFTTKIPKWLADNLPWLTGTNWEQCSEQLEYLRTHQTIEAERKVADFFDKQFYGVGPKQARNLLQILGLTRYEIPVDSRITKWLRKMDFPIPLSANLLVDSEYYEFIEDGIQALCAACDVYPCVLDAAIFASFDKEAWTAEISVW